MSESMFQPATVDTIGRDSGKSLAEEINEALVKGARELQDELKRGDVSITVSMKMTSPDNGMTIRIIPDVKYVGRSAPRRATVAFYGKQGLVTQEGMQPSLPLDNVTPISK